jgi:hypothetical protein
MRTSPFGNPADRKEGFNRPSFFSLWNLNCRRLRKSVVVYRPGEHKIMIRAEIFSLKLDFEPIRQQDHL